MSFPICLLPCIAIAGLSFLLTANPNHWRGHFLDRRERWPYLCVFGGRLLTAFGSSYYHLLPSNARLGWDRLPMTIAFMAMVATIIAERINLRAGLYLLPAPLVVGLASVFGWYASELRGAGDLRLYAAVQAYSALFLLLALLSRSATRGELTWPRSWDSMLWPRPLKPLIDRSSP